MSVSFCENRQDLFSAMGLQELFNLAINPDRFRGLLKGVDVSLLRKAGIMQNQHQAPPRSYNPGTLSVLPHKPHRKPFSGRARQN